MVKNWLNNTIYPIKEIGKYPQVIVERVIIRDQKGIKIAIFPGPHQNGATFELTKHQIRMLIRRLEQCMEE